MDIYLKLLDLIYVACCWGERLSLQRGAGKVLITISGIEKQLDELFIKLFFAGNFQLFF